MAVALIPQIAEAAENLYPVNQSCPAVSATACPGGTTACTPGANLQFSTCTTGRVTCDASPNGGIATACLDSAAGKYCAVNCE